MNAEKGIGALQVMKLDFFMIRPYIKSSGWILALLIIAVGGFSSSLTKAVPFVMVFMSMTVSYPFNITDRSGLERLYGSLPVTRRQMVAGRYLYCIFQEALFLFVALLVGTISCFMRNIPFSAQEAAVACVAGLLIYTVCTAVEIPGYYKFGSIKGRMIVAVPFLIMAIISTLFTQSVGEVDAVVPADGGVALPVLIASGLAAAVVIYAVSMLLSMRIMERKEF